METAEFLLAWTPFLLEGFLMNLVVGGSATLLGTTLALAIVLGRRALPVAAPALDFTTSLFRNIPTLVFVFYAASLLPREIELLPGTVVPVASWFKAAIALAAAPLGLSVWHLQSAITAWREDRRQEALLLLPNWLGTLLISVMASSTASLIGVGELVGRANTLITATGSVNMLAIYAYASAFFVLFSVCASSLLARLKRLLVARI